MKIPSAAIRYLSAAYFGIVACVGYAAAAPTISAESLPTRTPLVELYTSEGCSSCPPADDFLRELGAALTADFHALPLALHVDYWNYLGWHDPFSSAKFTARQRAVARNNRQRNIYTPELVVDGREARAGNGIIAAIQRANQDPSAAQIRLEATRAADAIVARVFVDNASAVDAEAFVVVFERDITREIRGGENRGRTLRHDFVARHWSAPKHIAIGANTLHQKIKIPAAWNARQLGLAVVILTRTTGATVQTAQISLAELFAG